MQLYNLRNKQLASQYVAIEFLKQIKARPDAVLGLATGSTMTDLYTYTAVRFTKRESRRCQWCQNVQLR